MKYRVPKPLKPGDTIAITAVSSGVAAPMHPRLDLAVDALRSRGFRVIEGNCLRSNSSGASASRQERAAELMQFLTDPTVMAVMPPWGGELAIELLDLIDFEKLRFIEPKWFSGFSDVSTIAMPLLLLSGWCNLHGPNLMQLAAADLDETTAAIWDCLSYPNDAPVIQYSSSCFEIVAPDYVDDPAAGFNFVQRTEWKRLDGLKEAVAFSGRLIGGCVDVVARLAGTRYGDVPDFIQSAGCEGAFLYLENAELKPFELARALHGLRLNGWFEGLSGLLIGRNAAPAQNSSFGYVDALNSALANVGFPVLYDADVGHLAPQLSLVNGALATVEFCGSGAKVVQHIASDFVQEQTSESLPARRL